MTGSGQCGGRPSVMHRRLVNALYTEALLIADEARDLFDTCGRDEPEPLVRVGIACEALKVTTRLMQVVAWLLTQRAVDAGELTVAEALHPSRRLGTPPPFDAAAVARMPQDIRRLAMHSVTLYRRAAAHDAALACPVPAPSPARALRAMLATRV